MISLLFNGKNGNNVENRKVIYLTYRSGSWDFQAEGREGANSFLLESYEEIWKTDIN